MNLDILDIGQVDAQALRVVHLALQFALSGHCSKCHDGLHYACQMSLLQVAAWLDLIINKTIDVTCVFPQGTGTHWPV